MRDHTHGRPWAAAWVLLVAVLLAPLFMTDAGAQLTACTNEIKADVVALDQPYYLNRLGAVNANGMIYALKRDTVNKLPACPVAGDLPVPLSNPAVCCPNGQGDPNNPTLCADGTAAEPVVPAFTPCTMAGAACGPGNVALRPDKRPRPLTLRVNKGGCLAITFTNWLSPAPFIFNFANDFDRNAVLGQGAVPPGVTPTVINGVNFQPIGVNVAQVFAPQANQFDDQPVVREASIHVNGMQLVTGIADDGSFVGRNPSSLAAPGQTKTYTLYAEYENVFHLYSMGSVVGGEGGGGSMGYGLFGAIVVEPGQSEWYRSQVTHEELVIAVDQGKYGNKNGFIDPDKCSDPNILDLTLCVAPATIIPSTERWANGQPKIDYDVTYPAKNADGTDSVWVAEGKAGLPVLKMLNGNAIVHTDLRAIITGPNRGEIPLTNAQGVPNRYRSTSVNPQQNMPFREFASIWNDEQVAVQPFTQFFKDPVLVHTFVTTRDAFIIDMASYAIGPQIVANRLGVGPMFDCVDCKAEEFFLTSWAIGDVGIVTDTPAVFAPFVTGVPIGAGPIATKTLWSEDPANVEHSYMNDHAKIRNVHAGPFEHHIFHMHGHQWVFAPQSDKANYMDMQQISPGSGYTMDFGNGGTGNRHKTPGDAIYH